MPISASDPFFIAEQASFVAFKANRPVDDLTFLRAYYQESGVSLNDCEIATATYLKWHESLLLSGVRFEEHLAKLGIPSCKMDQNLVNQFTSQKERALQEKMSYVMEQERASRNKLIALASGAGIIATTIAFILVRRRSRSKR